MRDLYVAVTAKILADLKAGVTPWRRPWSVTPGRNTPCNGATDRRYNGVNVVLLWMAMRAHEWPTARFVTFRQALELGGHVRKGEHGHHICYVGNSRKVTESEGEDDEQSTVQAYRFLKTYTVFNVAQCDGLPGRLTAPPIVKPRHRDARDPLIEEFIAATGAKVIEEDGGDAAFFQPKFDRIVMPAFITFDSAGAYYGTLFHELGHWTGHKTRLNRDMTKRFGRQAHAAEELIAELAAAFLCAEFDIDGDPRLSGYVAEYIRLLEGDPKAFFTCASKAQAAVDYLRELALRAPAQAAAE
jgi:antirestriction protein ArdC